MIPLSDYKVYLVTDRSIGGYSPEDGISYFLDDISSVLSSGVKIIQLREKNISTREFTILANRVKELVKKHNGYLIINDNIDVAIKVKADGVHVGQEDKPLAEVLKLIRGHKMAVGVSVSTPEEAMEAVKGGATYLGVGPVYPTSTKILTKSIIGLEGVKEILKVVPLFFPIVCIGGINSTNLEEVIEKTKTERRISGVVVVSAIMSAENKRDAVDKLLKIINSKFEEGRFDVAKVLNHLQQLQIKKPVVHHLTNLVAINDNANVTLAFGGSPIMAPASEEVEAITKISNSLLINIGTLNLQLVDVMVEAGKLSNLKGNPVILDPVGVGASPLRFESCLRLLENIKFTAIKGNRGEICKLAQIEATSRGVDSVDDGSLSFQQAVQPALLVAQKYSTTVVMTGETDFIVDREKVYTINNGHKLMSEITASGCMLGSLLATSLAMKTPNENEVHDVGTACLTALLVFTVSGELAASQSSGPGTFKPLLIDHVYKFSSNWNFKGRKVHPIQQLYKVITTDTTRV